MRPRRWLACAPVLLAGCIVIGTDASEFGPSGGPEGATLLTRRGESVVGELIAVNDTSVVVLLTTGRVAIGPFSRLPQIRVAGLDQHYNFGGGSVPGDSTRERLRLVSRFPQGAWRAWGQSQMMRSGQRAPGLLVGPAAPQGARP